MAFTADQSLEDISAKLLPGSYSSVEKCILANEAKGPYWIDNSFAAYDPIAALLHNLSCFNQQSALQLQPLPSPTPLTSPESLPRAVKCVFRTGCGLELLEKKMVIDLNRPLKNQLGSILSAAYSQRPLTKDWAIQQLGVRMTSAKGYKLFWLAEPVLRRRLQGFLKDSLLSNKATIVVELLES